MVRPFVLALCLLSAPALASAQDCPDWRLHAPKSIEANADALYTQYQSPTTAGGDVHLTECAGIPGIGYLTKNPDLSVQYDALGRGRQLEFRVLSDCDTTLLVNMPDEQYAFADDEDGLSPVMRIQAADSGLYDIWVGTIDSAYCAAVLQIETF